MAKKFLEVYLEKIRKIYKINDIEEVDKKTIEETYVEAAVTSNKSFFLFMCIFIVFVELFNIFRVFFLTNGIGISTLNNFTYFSFYLTLLIIAALYIYINKKISIAHRKLYRIQMVGGVIFLVWQALFNAYDIIRTGASGNFTLPVAFMAFTAIFRMKPIYFFLNVSAMSVLFLIIAGQVLSFGVKFNYVIMLLLCVAIYYHRYKQTKKEFVQRIAVEAANKAYLDERERFRLTNEQYEIVCRYSQLITFKWDIQKDEVYFSEQWGTALGQPLYIAGLESFVKESRNLQSMDKKNILDCVENVKSGIPYQKLEIRIPGKDGHLHWYELRLTIQENSKGEPILGIGILLDIMEHKQEIKKMHQRAERDFTGVLNKSAIEKYGRERIEQLSEDETFIMLVMDMDNFKYINDTMGHPVGDYVLSEVAAHMKESALPGMRIGRIGGDEFVALFAGTSTLSLRLANAFAEKMQNYIQGIRLVDGNTVVKVSIGAAAISKDSKMTFDELYEEADKALYEAKKAGKGKIRWGGVDKPEDK